MRKIIRWFFSDRYSLFELAAFVILLGAADLPFWGDFMALFALFIASSAVQQILLKDRTND